MTQISAAADVSAQTSSAMRWSAGGQVGRQFLVLVTNILLARMLEPASFGIIGMALVFAGLADVFRETWLRPALVQAPVLGEDLLSSAFWLSVTIGAVLSLALVTLSPWISSLLGEVEISGLLMALALRFFVDGFALVHLSVAQRKLEMRWLAIVDFISLAAASLSALAAAALGLGPWSLVMLWLGQSLLATTLLLASASWRPRLRFDWPALKNALGFASSSAGFGLLNYAARNVDNLLVGKFLGAAALGIYGRAYALLLYPLQTVTGTVGRVLFPSLARARGRSVEARALLLATFGGVAVLTFPASAGLAMVAPEFVRVVFGEPWLSMIPVLRWFCVASLVQSVVALSGHVFLATGRPDIQLRVSGSIAVAVPIVVLLAIPHGLVAVAAAYTALTLVAALPQLRAAAALAGLTLGQIGRELLPLLGCSLAMTVIVALSRVWLPAGLGPFARLVALSLVGAFAYAGMMLLLRPRGYRTLVMWATHRAQPSEREA